MMRSLYSSVSGLQVHQILMDVLANNVANVNTNGYKKATVSFQDMLSQTIQGAQAASTDGLGGTNPQQIALGVKTGAITNVMTQGASSTTGNNTDLMIQGEGYFVVTDGTNKFYTRAGSFTLDDEGNLVNSGNGMKLCDVDGNAINLGVGAGNVSISSSGTISYTDDGGNALADKVIGLATFTNPAGLTKYGQSLYQESSSSGAASDPLKTPGTDSGSLIAGSLEMSNVDLAQEFVNMIVAERGFQANSKSIQTTDSMLEQLINTKR
jgi:flagellar hook protein FlgE